MPFQVANGINIYYELHGAGPKLMVISGSGADLRSCPPSDRPFYSDFMALYFDQRGLGRTDKPRAPYTMADYADDAAALSTALGWERFHVFGESFGGMVALNLVVTHPGLIDRLVLCCTSPGGTAASYPLHTLHEFGPRAAFETRMRLLDERWDPDSPDPIPGLGLSSDELAARVAFGLDADAVEGRERLLVARAQHDVVADLPNVVQPTLVCAGRFDGLAPVANSQVMADLIPNAELEIFEGGHPFLEQDRRAFKRILRFLAS